MHKAFIILVISFLCFFNVAAQDCPSGDVNLNSQDDIDAFLEDYPNCEMISGNLFIQDFQVDPIINLFPLRNITQISGSLIIQACNSLTGIGNLNNITAVGGDIIIEDNPNLSQCDLDVICQNFSTNGISFEGNNIGCRDVEEVQSNCLNPNCPNEIEDLSLLGEFNGHTYFISEFRSTWANAQQATSQIANGNASLVSFEDAEENNAILSFIGQIGLPEDVFIGINDRDNEGELNWDSGEDVGYTNFDEPFVNDDDQDFGIMNFATGKWSLANGLRTAFYVVELNCDALVPDLILSELYIGPDDQGNPIDSTGSRQEMPYRVNVGNIGSGVADIDSIVIRTYFSLDTELDINVDSLGGEIFTGFNNPGEISESPANVIIPTNIEGPHYLISHIDFNNKVVETNENNNIVVSSNQVDVIDLTDFCIAGSTVLWTQTQLDTLLDDFVDCITINGDFVLLGTDLDGNPSDDPITSLEPLEQISTINGELQLINLPMLEKLEGLENLTGINGALSIIGTELEHLDELANLDVLGGLNISDNQNLTSLAGLNNLELIFGSHSIIANGALTELYALNLNLEAIERLEIIENTALTDCSTDFICSNLSADFDYTFENNGPSCESNQEVEEGCDFIHPITFEIFLDLDENGERNNDEPNYADGFLEVEDEDIRFYMGNNESIRRVSLPEGDYTLVFDQVQFPDWLVTTGDNQFDFNIQSGIIPDPISVGIRPVISDSEEITMLTYVSSPKARCLTEIEVEVCAKNTGFVAQSGRYFLDLDERVDIVSFVDTPDEVTADGLYGYDYSQVQAGQIDCKRIKVKIPSPVDFPLGTMLEFNSHILDGNNERLAEFNYLTELKCSFDPNDKAIFPSREGNINLIDEFLRYRIRFQNTGNDTAFQVVIRDTLDDNLDPNTFELIGAEFELSPDVQIIEGRILTFQFDDILLPDSTTNYLGSQGALSYRIRARQNIPEGTIIENTASIFFDFNPPVVTNTITSIMYEELPPCDISSYIIDEQIDVDNFRSTFPDCERIRGNIFIVGDDITNLNGLSHITFIEGSIIIQGTMLETLDGLNDLVEVSENFEVRENMNIINFSGIEELKNVGSDLIILENNSLDNFAGLESLPNIGNRLIVERNNSLRNFKGFDNLNRIGGDFRCQKNDMLNSFNGPNNLDGLNKLVSIGGNFIINENDSLDGLNGLNNIDFINGNLEITNNPSLATLIGLSELNIIGGDLMIINNASLQVLTGFNDLETISEKFILQDNPLLENFSGLGELTSIEDNFEIARNQNLQNFAGLGNLERLGDDFTLNANPSLTSLEGLGSLSKIDGVFTVIGNQELTNLKGAESLSIIIGGLELGNCSLTTLEGLGSVQTLGNLIVAPANDLLTFSGLDQLESISGDLKIEFNQSLASLNGLTNLRFITGDLTIENTLINSMSGLDNLERIQGSLILKDSPEFSNIESLSNLEVLGNELYIQETKLTKLEGLHNLDNIDGHITITENPELDSCHIVAVCSYLDDGNEATVLNNATNCDNQEEIQQNCVLQVDNDNDGFIASEDCDDNDPNINPNAIDIPNNGIDEDCDGEDLVSATHQIGDQIIDIYPNPANDFVIIEGNHGLSLQYECIDLRGKIIYKGVINNPRQQIDISALQAGVYILKIYDTAVNQFVLDKLIKL